MPVELAAGHEIATSENGPTQATEGLKGPPAGLICILAVKPEMLL
jgi:hypothetical protein